MKLLCTSKHRVWSPKHRLVRNIPETFKGLGLSQQTAVCPQKAMLAGMVHYLKGKPSIFKTGILPSGNNSSNAFVKSSTVSYSEFER